MYTRKFVKGLLIPSFGVGVVHAKGEQDKEDCDDSKKLVRARELPLYVESPKCVTCSNKIDDEDGFLITTIRCARQELQQIVGQARMIQSEVQNIAEEVVKETEDAVSYLRQEDNLLPRLGAIGLGGFAGYLLSCRKGIIKKTLYSAAGAGLVAAVAYPNQAREYTEEVMCEVKKYAVIGYHFLNGADVDWEKLETIKPPCFAQKDGAQIIQGEKGKPEPDQTGKNRVPEKAKSDSEKPEPCIDQVKAAEKSGIIDKRSYTERCRERGVCGAVKKKPAAEGTATKCDPDCTGPKRGSRLKQSDSEAKSRSKLSDPQKCDSGAQGQSQQRACPVGCIPAPVGDPSKTGGAPEQCKPQEKTVDQSQYQSQPKQQAVDPCKSQEQSQPKQQTVDPCKCQEQNQPKQQTVDTSKSQEQSQPKQQTMDPCGPIGTTGDSSQLNKSTADPPGSKAGVVPQQSGSNDQGQYSDSSMSLKESSLPASVNPSVPIESTCRRKRRANWDEQSGERRRSRGRAGGCKQCPITGGVANEKQGPNTGSEQCDMTPCKRDTEPDSGVKQEPTARDPSDPCKSAIKRSSVTIAYPNPPGSAESCVVMSPNEKKPCGRSPMPPKEVTMGSHPRKATVLGENSPPDQSVRPRLTSRRRTRQRRETPSEIDDP